ncbi:hydroxymethylbilane synthase [Lichenicoccus roseus]|uniref:Porphobilinogen deaminase n=1 Tax=Lichenicoccus roseus TaxID=2683649 RepID=A0A5R9J8Y8_9PROT|nr:hydroxymethylbilane synthase [Lichenicoccus roseus]TLU74080.1 hydroxymethylbilane synthase [Lichenicoccus roseus]
MSLENILATSPQLLRHPAPAHRQHRQAPRHAPTLPLRVGTRASPLALTQTRGFLSMLSDACPALGGMDVFREQVMGTTGDAVQHCRLAEIGGKGLFAKEIHEALLDGRIDLAVHSMKDLETALPPGIVLACVLTREDPRDVLILADDVEVPDAADPLSVLPHGALIGTSSVRRQAQLLHARPDLRITLMRGNVQSRLDKVAAGRCDASLLALAGLKRLGLESEASVVLQTEVMLPSAAQGIVAVTAREDDVVLRELMLACEDRESRIAADAERALLRVLDGSCRSPIAAVTTRLQPGQIRLTGLVAREDGSFLLRDSIDAPDGEAELAGEALGHRLKQAAPADIFL